MSSHTMERLRAALSQRYALERELGKGRMATVYLADDIKHERKVALKVVRPELAHADDRRGYDSRGVAWLGRHAGIRFRSGLGLHNVARVRLHPNRRVIVRMNWLELMVDGLR